MKVLYNVSFIVIGVMIASLGELKFVLLGFLVQVAGIMFEAIRLVMVQRLLSSSEFKMDPLVSLYYFAPVCAAMNFCVAMFTELPRLQMTDIMDVGVWTLLANAMVAFGLNVSVVFLVRLSFHRNHTHPQFFLLTLSLFSRSAKLHLWFSPSAACSRTSCSSRPR